MTALEYLQLTYTGKEYCVRERVVCKDGFSISIQGGTKFHYCTPRETCNEYEAVELGYPSQLDSLLKKYAEEPGSTQTVFAQVPIAVVEKLIKKHGGII